MSEGVYTFEEIAGKAEWEGGLDEALDWFNVEDVPVEIQSLWLLAKRQKLALDVTLNKINTFLPE